MDANQVIFVADHAMSFNPRARDGREFGRNWSIKKIKVSIHAPVMDAKCMWAANPTIREVSIHAPVMDANPLWAIEYEAGTVSIHAPVMDAKPRRSYLRCT